MTLTCEHQDWPDFTVFLTIKISTKNISKTLILENKFPVPRNTAASKFHHFLTMKTLPSL